MMILNLAYDIWVTSRKVFCILRCLLAPLNSWNTHFTSVFQSLRNRREKAKANHSKASQISDRFSTIQHR